MYNNARFVRDYGSFLDIIKANTFLLTDNNVICVRLAIYNVRFYLSA